MRPLTILKKMQLQLNISCKENLYIAIQTMLAKKNISIAIGSISTLQSNEDWAYLFECLL